MKKLLLTFSALLLAVGMTMGQKPFEGTIKFDMKMLGEGAEQFAAFAPTATVYQFRGSDIRIEMIGGMTAAMMGPIVVKGDDGNSFMIKDSEQAVYKFESDENDKEDASKSKVTKEDEEITILGYTCQKYKVVTATSDKDVESYIWACKDLQLKKPKKTRGSAGQLFIEGIEGTPLKIMATVDAMGMNMTTILQASEVKEEKLSKDLFEIPSNYTEKDGASIMGGLMGK